jgi:hypothetical protein
VTFADDDAAQAAKSIRDGSEQRVWGTWGGLFGIASNELIVVTVAGEPGDNQWPAGVVEVSCEQLRATVRPTSEESLTREGLYVFRSFYIDAAHIDRVVELSQLAWQTFETSSDYQTEPTGLFAPVDPTPNSVMYLLTWYDGLNSWQTSRKPVEEARNYFRERHALMRSTSAVATRLII